MRLKNVPGSREKIAECEYVIKEKSAGRWAEIFGNTAPLRLEIGMGKGAFIMENARLRPDINFVGIEKYSSVLIRAVEKQEEALLPNIRFLRMEAEYIEEYFAPGEADRIYLNFSDPWPKERHAKRRLTSQAFLARYFNILKDGGEIEFKTDNTELFEFSVSEAAAAGWEILLETRDLHKSPYAQGNIMTEYEEKFAAQGNKICKYIIRKP